MDYIRFTKLLLQWHIEKNKREMPWKGEKDPYKVWLSEVILQQTRVDQGMAYYKRFVKKYPTVKHLAAAKEEEVFKLWEGLGYYTRCKNLLWTARFIVDTCKSEFPCTYENISKLKGVGPYTAAAISSFCFNLPYAVVDGNVFRVLARVFGEAIPIDCAEGKKHFQQLAAKVLDKINPGIFNQSIMDFGALVCKPLLPLCSDCTLNSICIAFRNGKVNVLPVKEKVIQKKIRWFNYFVIEAEGKLLVRQRAGRDIWQNLFEFYLIETQQNQLWNNNMVEELFGKQLGIYPFETKEIIRAEPQQLTHQHINGYFIYVILQRIPQVLSLDKNLWRYPLDIDNLAFPKFINTYINKKKIGTVLF